MTGIQTLDSAVGATEEWVNALMARLGWQDLARQGADLSGPARGTARAARRAATRRGRVSWRATASPVAWPLFRGLASRKPHPESEKPQTFVERIQEGVHRDPGIDAEAVAHAVFALLAERLPPGEVEDAKAATPEALRMFWPA